MMEHKAYLFDWTAFERDALHGLLQSALATGDTEGLAGYIGDHLEDLKNPYDAGPLDEYWEELLEAKDAHEYGDFALTRFYDPAEDGGIGAEWMQVDGLLAAPDDKAALLGTAFGKGETCFDPGRMGSYFQTPAQVADSLRRVRQMGRPELEEFAGLLAAAAAAGSGIYVTF
ncbi:MAG TPA: hypothetical protein VGN52_25515 [Burkholderiales bacterium]|jgi:hypothetical protein